MSRPIIEEKEIVHEFELELTRYVKKVNAFKEELASELLEGHTSNWNVKARASLRRAGLDLKTAITELNKKL
jgi:hypothetical protein